MQCFNFKRSILVNSFPVLSQPTVEILQDIPQPFNGISTYAYVLETNADTK